jgi:hypothetical protein
MTQRPRRLRLRSSRRVSSELSFGPERPTVDNRPMRSLTQLTHARSLATTGVFGDLSWRLSSRIACGV